MSETTIIMPVEHRRTLPAPTAEVTSIFQVLERAARDPNVDVDKMERLMAMVERSKDREAETAFAAAMSDAQAELTAVATDASNPQTKSRYASYPALDKACRPVYARHGFALSFGTAEGAPADCLRVICHVSHREGHTRDYHVDMPADGKGAKGGDVMTKTHAVGAAMSYGQRYLLKLIFNIAVGDDADGNSNGGPGNRDQSTASEAAITAVNACNTFAKLKEWKATQWAGVSKLLSPVEADRVIRLVNERSAKLKEAEGAGFPGDRP